MRAINTRWVLAATLAALVLGGTGVAKADLYDLAADWSDTDNPNGAWSYWVGGAPPAVSYHRGGDPFNNPPGYQPIWAHTSNTYFGWSKSNGSNSASNPTWDLQPGDVYGHTQGLLEIRWTSPEAGSADVSGGVWAIRDIGRSNSWQVTLNGSVLASGYVYSGDAYDRANPFPIDLSFDVGVGDVVAFSARPDSTHGDGIQDYIALNLSIDVVPVPVPAAALLGLLGLSVAGVKLRKRA